MNASVACNIQCQRFWIANGALLLSFAVVFLSSPVFADDSKDVARWDFGTEATSVFATHGAVLRDQAGPRPPEFPDFDSNNTAIRLDRTSSYLAITDPGSESVFDFAQGDAITLEAWVKLDGPSKSNSPVYVIGKGRTKNPHMSPDNQNWALRLVPSGKQAKISFLFATKYGPGDKHWHRWTSQVTLSIAAGWHHVAVAYRFGEPDTIRGWIDGKPSNGSWDMGGATTEPPIVDNDDVWIGSAAPGNSLVGSLDAVAVHRKLLDDEVISSRFKRVGGVAAVMPQQAVMPDLGMIPRDQVLVTFADGLPASDRWPNEGEAWPAESTRWRGEWFLLPRLPRRYDDWGIRDDWKGPLLLRMAADVELPPGNHRFLLWARGLGRLWVDGVLVATTEPVVLKSPDGEQSITPVTQPPLPGLRAHGYHQQEVFGEGTVKTTSRVVLELVVGGKGQRIETGEVGVAVQSADGLSYEILHPANVESLPLTDTAVELALANIETSLARLDDETRRHAASTQDAFWEQRHQTSRQWAKENPILVDAAGVSNLAMNPVDGFIQGKIDRAIKAASATDPTLSQSFHERVLPILRDQCFRCHGDKEKGGLKLNSRAAALHAGESELAAVVPGDPEASELIAQVRSGAMPPTETGLSEEQIMILEQWIRDGAAWPAPPITTEEVALAPLVGDEAFLRRVYLDTVGVPPSIEAAKSFLRDQSPHRRTRLIDRLLDDDSVADQWVSYWQDVLAENPTLLNSSMGSTGPFRWFLYDALRDRKPLDRMVTELIMMRGNEATGGSAAFAIAGESDAPLAAKSLILAAAFLGIELQCARCHDSPYHSTTQRDLYSLAAMLDRKSVKVPSTSRVPEAFFEKKGRESLIKVTLKPDEAITPNWPFSLSMKIEDNAELDPLVNDRDDSRERLAALFTSPQNPRFGQVIVNRVWQRLMGAGFVEPVDDWEGQLPSHPDLLAWLTREFIANDYDLGNLMRLILTSDAYAREAVGTNLAASAEQRFFSAPDRRRLSAEQIVDSLYTATGNRMDVEELTFVHDGRRTLAARQSLGCPTRAWRFAGLNNERDRPSLSLPKARTIVDVLEAFGWNSNRQKPISVRETEPNLLQPGVLSNGTLAMTLTRATIESELSRCAVAASSPESLVDEWFLRVLCRFPRDGERTSFANALAEGFDKRMTPTDRVKMPEPLPPLPLVTWFNHLQPETSTIQQEIERRVSQGPPVDPRLEPSWRAIYEDFVWSLINHREFVWIP